ncbi:MAG: hypothetical protein GY869_30300 [Planctomycetes bacterium]|nr:hypothetical protein [Planctomycetota bacterium]
MKTDLIKLSSQAALIVLIIALLALWPCSYFGPEKGLTALLTAALVCFVPVCISLVPLAIAVKRQADWLAQACLGGTVARMLLTLLIGTIVYLIIKPPMITFVICLLVFYMALLAWETIISVKFIQAYYASTGANEPKPLPDNN